MRWTTGSAMLMGALALGLASPGFGQNPAEPARPAVPGGPGVRATPATPAMPGMRNDANFVRQAAASGIAEVLTGELALDKAESEEVREFAERMVEDHTDSNNRLAELARAEGFDVPAETDDMHKQIVERLNQLSGEEFDREYIAGQVADHEAAVELFRQQAEDGKNEALRNFAELTLPTLELHLEHALELQAAD